MAIRSLFYLSIITILLYSCNSGPQQQSVFTAGCDTISIDVKNQEDLFRTSLFIDTIKLIVLANQDEQIGKIDFIRINNDIIYAVSSNTLFAIDLQGNIISKINKRGKGPEEYVEISNLLFDNKNNKLMIADIVSSKLLVYKPDLQFERINPDIIVKDKMGFADDFYYMYFNNKTNLQIDGDYYNIGIYSSNGKLAGKKFKIDEDNLWFTYSQKHNFYFFNTGAYFIEPFINKIYFLDNGDIKPKYLVDFGEFNLPGNFFRNIESTDIRISNLAASKYAGVIDYFVEMDNYIYFTYVIKNDIFNVVYSKKKKNIISGKTLHDDKFGLPMTLPITGYKDYLVVIIEPFFLHYIVNECKKQYSVEKQEQLWKGKYRLVKELSEKYDESSNPIIALYQLKD